MYNLVLTRRLADIQEDINTDTQPHKQKIILPQQQKLDSKINRASTMSDRTLI